MFDWPTLSLTIWIPIIGGVLVLGCGDREPSITKWTALVTAVLTLLISTTLYSGFDAGTASMQFVEHIAWIPAFGINYHLGVDGISMPLILLTTFTTVVVVIAGWEIIEYKPSHYMAAFLIMNGVMVGVFAALDAILFYVFWEAMLIPMFLIIGVWGGANRVYATIKFFLYTFLGSVLMLIALIYLHVQTGNFDILGYHAVPLGQTAQTLVFLAFLAAFAVKVPMWPVHTWLPDAHVEAPTGGSVILAAVMLKMGGYGFLRFSLPIAPDASHDLAWLVIAMSLISIVYIGFVALVQQDMKKLIAYSSITHMGFVTLGFFIVFAALGQPGAHGGAVMGMEGGMVQMVSHGFVSGALFLCVGVLYERLHSRQISDYGGVINTMPVFGGLMIFFAMANAGLPGTSGFVGELMVILASFRASSWYGLLAATSLILGAAYTLWMVKRVIFGPVGSSHVGELQDISRRELLVLGTLAVIVLAFGLYPAPLIDLMEPTLKGLIAHLQVSKLVQAVQVSGI